MSIWKKLFYELLDEVAQIPHPMAEEIVKDYAEQAREEEI
jgi:hypothetical protein